MTEPHTLANPWPNIAVVEGRLFGLGPRRRLSALGGPLTPAVGSQHLSESVARPLMVSVVTPHEDAHWLMRLKQQHPGQTPAVMAGEIVYLPGMLTD